jgi:hypothetical protein
MKYLSEKKARDAVVRAMRPHFVVPEVGTRVDWSTVEFELIHRNNYADKPIYRTRLSEEGVLMGGFVGAREVAP